MYSHLQLVLLRYVERELDSVFHNDGAFHESEKGDSGILPQRDTEPPKHTYTGISLYLTNTIFRENCQENNPAWGYLCFVQESLSFFLLALVSQPDRKSVQTSVA